MRKENIIITVLISWLLISGAVSFISFSLRKDPEEEQVVERKQGESTYLERGDYEIWLDGWTTLDMLIIDPF